MRSNDRAQTASYVAQDTSDEDYSNDRCTSHLLKGVKSAKAAICLHSDQQLWVVEQRLFCNLGSNENSSYQPPHNVTLADVLGATFGTSFCSTGIRSESAIFSPPLER